jgi:hypothetical protein
MCAPGWKWSSVLIFVPHSNSIPPALHLTYRMFIRGLLDALWLRAVTNDTTAKRSAAHEKTFIYELWRCMGEENVVRVSGGW